MKQSLRKLTIMALFVALGVSLGYFLAPIPNVELVTMTIFIAGFLFGIKEGFLIGLFTEFLYSTLSPYGLAAPPIFIAQIFSMSITGVAGGLMARYIRKFSWIEILLLGMIGLLVTLIFAVLTTVSYSLFSGFTGKKLIASFLTGIHFYLAHLISNTLIFLLLVPHIIRLLIRVSWNPLIQQGSRP